MLLGPIHFLIKNLKNIKNKKKINFEIIGSANKLQRILKIKIINFSFNFGRLEHISPTILNLSKKRFKYVFTGIRGENLKSKKIFLEIIFHPMIIFLIYTLILVVSWIFYTKREKKK